MMPLYGFLEGDTLGLLIISRDDEHVEDLATKLQQAARMRVAPHAAVKILHQGRILEPLWTVKQAGLKPLDRFDVVEKK